LKYFYAYTYLVTTPKTNKRANNSNRPTDRILKIKMSFNQDSTTYDVKQSLSLVIPRVFPQYVDEQEMIDIFDRQHLGRVYKVNMIHMTGESRRRGHPMYKAIVYFSAWYNNIVAYNFQQRIFNKREAKVVYDDPWFWVAMENKEQRLSNNDKRIMRVAYQNYLNEQKLEKMSISINQMENHLTAGWSKLTTADAMRAIGDELSLTETAMDCVERVLYDE
jgi:hypothetical protein